MAGFGKVLPHEGMWSPLQARFELRQTFDRWLSCSRAPHFVRESGEMVDELSLLDLCEHYRLEYSGGAADIARTWDESEERIADGGPVFADLVRLGWVFFDGGCWVMQPTALGTPPHIESPRVF